MEYKKINELTEEECKEAFIKIKDKLTLERREMLDINSKRDITATEMAKEVFNNKSYGIANSAYGKLAHEFHDALKNKYFLESKWWIKIFVEFKKNDNNEWLWIMRKPVKKAWMQVR